MLGGSMQVNKLIKTVQEQGRSNVPRYLYHITTKGHYNKMVKDGFINTSRDVGDESLRGVFMFDLKNFTKRWCFSGFDCIDWQLSFAKALLLKIAQKSSDVVLLRIPTRTLPLNKLRCRSQLSQDTKGVNAVKQKHYTRKKQAIEYIYQKSIPMKYVQKVGEVDTKVDLSDFSKSKNAINNFDIIQLLADFCHNQPESQCIEVAKKNSSEFKKII